MIWPFGSEKTASVEFRVDAETERRINALPQECASKLARAVRDTAARLAPKKTGVLSRYIRVSSPTKRMLQRGNFAHAYVKTYTRRRRPSTFRKGYGAAVEYGHFIRRKDRTPTKYVRPRAFLGPALLQTVGRTGELLQGILEKGQAK